MPACPYSLIDPSTEGCYIIDRIFGSLKGSGMRVTRFNKLVKGYTAMVSLALSIVRVGIYYALEQLLAPEPGRLSVSYSLTALFASAITLVTKDSYAQ